MKTQLLVAALLFGTLFVACAQTKKTTSAKKQAKTSANKSNLRGFSEVTMRRGACFGRCPEYTITVRKDGTLEYNGTRNTMPLGTFQKNIGIEKAQALLQQFADFHADTCRAYYIARVADVPTLSFRITVNGKEQSIGNAGFGPQYLGELAAEIDAMGKVDDGWKKIGEAPPQD